MGQGSYPNNSQGMSGGPQQMVGWLDRNFVYGTHITVGAGGVAWRYNRTTGTTETIDLSTVVGNVLELPLFRPADGHYGLVCGVDRADYMHVVGNNHDGLDSIGPLYHHVVCTNPAAFTNPASWVQGSEPGRLLTTSTDCGVYTYNYFDRLTNGDLLWFASQSDIRGDSRGRDIIGFRSTAGADTWVPILSSGGEFARSEKQDPQGTTADRVYVNTILVDPVYGPDGTTWLYDLIWYWGIWRTMAEDAEFQQQPFLLYGKSTDLNTWFAADGTALTMPYAWATRAPALCPYANVFSINVRTGIWTPPGPPPKPVAVCLGNGNSTVGNPNQYRRLYFDGSAWSEQDDQYVNGVTPIEMNMPRNQHVYMQNSKGRVNFNGFVTGGGPAGPAYNYAVGPNLNNAGGGKFTPRHCPVLIREDKQWLANIGDGDNPRVYTIGGGYPAKVSA